MTNDTISDKMDILTGNTVQLEKCPEHSRQPASSNTDRMDIQTDNTVLLEKILELSRQLASKSARFTISVTMKDFKYTVNHSTNGDNHQKV